MATLQETLTRVNSLRHVRLRVVRLPRTKAAATTLRRLVLGDPNYKRLKRRGDQMLSGALVGVRYRCGRRRAEIVRAPRAGTEFDVCLTLHSADEIRSVQSLVEVAGEKPMSTATLQPKTVNVERFKVRFPNRESFRAALATESGSAALASDKRKLIAVEMEPTARADANESRLRALKYYEKEYGAEVVPDFQYAWEDSWGQRGEPELAVDDAWQATLNDVLHAIGAVDAWNVSRGGNVAIAIVDSGIDGSRREFPAVKRLGQISFPRDPNSPAPDPWTDDLGHGTMCACIAASSSDDADGFQGVAPDAGLISCRTRYFSTELTVLYDYLTDQQAALGMRIVANNSWGVPTGQPPLPDPEVVAALSDAAAAGIVLVFSAGNYHNLVPNPAGCSPNSIWTHKSLSQVITVATCDLDRRMWDYSSRGPGQWYQQAAYDWSHKPDVTAPTPAYGRILFGSQPRVLSNGWGTSGAAPQVAGLIALMLARNPALDAAQLFDIIRTTAQDLGLPATCQGAGLINCRAAVDQV